MMKNIQHPVISKWLTISEQQISLLKQQPEIIFISSFLPGFNEINSGILQAVKFRLSNPSHLPVIILSFQAKEELTQSDPFGILSLYGTEYLQLPVSVSSLSEAINSCRKKYHGSKLSIPIPEWNQFATKAYNQILSEILSQLKHGNQLDFVNNVTGPLRAACVASLSYPELQVQVQKQIQNAKSYILKQEISDLITLAGRCAGIDEEFLINVSDFSAQLSELASFSCNNHDEIKQLIFIIDNLNTTWSKIKAT